MEGMTKRDLDAAVELLRENQVKPRILTAAEAEANNRVYKALGISTRLRAGDEAYYIHAR